MSPRTRGRRATVAGAVGGALLLTCLAGATASSARTATGSGAGAVPRLHHAAPAPTPQRKGALAGKTVGIDPGHNGRNYTDPQYIDRKIWNGREYENCNTTGTATDGGYSEARFNFAVATDLRRDLAREGARVVMTRHNNHGVGPCVNRRAAIINKSHAVVGIDIHADGGPASGRGFAILEPVRDKENRSVIGSSARFGSVLRRAVLADTPMPTSTYDGHDGINHRDDLAGLNLTRVPLVLIECGNMRNPSDAHLLTSRHFQARLAQAFAAAITTFVRHRR
jgi:N-acetylmuramoyl-L-alanine amidase